MQDVAAEARADLEKVFGERDTAILMDALVEGIPHAQIADKYGVSRGRVAQLAGEDATGQAEREKKFAKAEKETGMSREYLRGLMGKLASMSKAVAPQEEADTGETMVSEGVGVLGDQAQADLGAAGFSTVDTEGASTSNWKDSTSKGAKVMTRQAKAKLEGLQDALQQAEEQGDEKRVDELSKEIAAVSSEYVSLEEKAAADTQSAYELSEKARELEEKIESARDAGQDTIATKNRKLTLEEAEAEVEAMHAKVMEMFEKVAAALEKGKAKKSEAKKPEVKKAAPKKVVKPAEATVATTPKQDSGQTLWDGLRKTSPDLVAYEDLTDNERGYLTELADRTGGKPKLKDELGLQELMGRTAPDSAADEEQFEREMRAAAGSKQSAPDDVKTTALRFVPYQTALAIARRAVDSGVPTNWVQFHTRLDLTNESATRLVAAIQAEQAGQGEGRTYESRTGTVQFKSSVGPAYNAKPEQLIDLVDNPGVAQAVSLLHKQGMSHALKSVANWFTTGDAHVDWDGIFTMVNGKASIVLSRMAMMLPEKASVTVLHEVGHAIDLPGPTAVFSNAPTLGVTIQGGEVMPMRPGSVMDEVLNYYEENGDNEALSQLLQYPFDRTKHGKLTAQQVRAEVFAQLWAFSNLQGGMQVLRDNLPATAVFMEKVHAKVKATQYTEAGSSQGSQSGQVRDRAEAGQDAYASRSAATPRIAKKEVDLLTRTLRTGADAALNAIVFSEDLFKRASKMGLTAAMEMDRIYRERAALTGNIEREVTRIENLFNRIPESAKGTGPKSANQFLYDSTRENKWGFRPTWRGADGSKVKVDPELAKRYNALPKEAREWISAVLQHGDKMLKTKKDTLIASTNSEYDALIADAKQRNETNKVTRLEADKAASLRQFQRLFATTEFNPYAPMRRFGDFVVIAKSKEYLAAAPSERAKMESDPDHYHVSFAESRASAVELERQLKDQGSFAEVNARTKEDARGDMYGGLMDAFNKLRGNIDSELNNATEPKEIAALRAARQTVAELYLQSLAENSARKSEMRRRGVAGEIDMLRSFSTQGRADAHFLASAKFNPQAQQAVVKMRQQVKEGGSQLEKSDAFKEIMARHTQSMRYEQGGWFDVASNASRVTSLWMLATSPMYYLQNMTQPFVLSLPFMAGKHAYADASGQLMRSYFQLGDLLKSAKLGEGFDFTKVSADKAEQDMILKLVDRGRIDIGMDTELGKVKLEGDSVVSKAANRADQLLRSLSQKVEAVNRVSTALAAYRLEIKAGRTPAQALEYADEVISQTHGDYTRINAPRAFNNPMGKVALQFRKFQLIQLTLLTKLVYNSFKGGTPAEKAAARRVLAFTLGHTGVLAGVVGMPGFAAAAFIINKLADAFGDDDDEPYNLENELRKMLGGGDVARMVMRGAPTLVGTDLSGKLGMGNALSILPYTDFEASREGFNAIATGLTLGATGGLGAKVFEGLGQIKDGDYYRGLLNLAPSGVAGAIKATMEASQGETNKRGDVLVSADEIAHWETFAKVIGWPTAAQSERRFDRQVAYDNKEAFENKASKLKNEYTKAVRGNDADSRRQIIEKWQKLQQSRREAGFQAQPLSALIKAPQEQAKRERNTTGGVQFDKRNRQFVQEQTAN